MIDVRINRDWPHESVCEYQAEVTSSSGGVLVSQVGGVITIDDAENRQVHFSAHLVSALLIALGEAAQSAKEPA